MRIVVNKSGRKISLTKREGETLDAAKNLLVELASSGTPEMRDAADVAADQIGLVQSALDGTPLLEPVA